MALAESGGGRKGFWMRKEKCEMQGARAMSGWMVNP